MKKKPAKKPGLYTASLKGPETTPPKRHGLLFCMAVGDAYGAGREFVDAEVVRNTNDLRYAEHPKWKIPPGRYTDDTQMAIGLTRFMLDIDPDKSMLMLAHFFLNTFNRLPRPGYSQGFYEILQKSSSETDLIRALVPFSKKNGGAMRAAPAGLLATEQNAIDFAMWQASLTHATQQGMMSAAGVALLVWGCRHDMPRENLHRFLNNFLPGYPWYVEWDDPVSTAAMDCVHAALTAIQKYDNLRDILWQCIDYTGDTDTTAAIAMAAASMHPGIEQNLPPNLIADLEGAPFGKEYLNELDDKLQKDFPLVKSSSPFLQPFGKELPVTVSKKSIYALNQEIKKGDFEEILSEFSSDGC